MRSKYLDEQSSFVSLQVYLDGVWTLHSQHPEIGGGTWNRRPAPPWTLWRIRNNNEIRVGGNGDGWNPGEALRIPVWEDWEPHLREDERGITGPRDPKQNPAYDMGVQGFGFF